MLPIQTNKELSLILEKSGVSRADINAAIILKRFIKKIDSSIFPKNPCKVYAFPLGHYAKIGKAIASYSWLSTNDNESELYVIFARDLAESVRRRMLPKKFRRISLKKLLVAVAAHEVRHRVQANKKPKMFRPEPKPKSDNDTVGNIIYAMKLIFDKARSEHKRRKRSKYYIKAATGRTEFDASIIEKLTLFLLINKSPLKNIIHLVKSGT